MTSRRLFLFYRHRRKASKKKRSSLKNALYTENDSSTREDRLKSPYYVKILLEYTGPFLPGKRPSPKILQSHLTVTKRPILGFDSAFKDPTSFCKRVPKVLSINGHFEPAPSSTLFIPSLLLLLLHVHCINETFACVNRVSRA